MLLHLLMLHDNIKSQFVQYSTVYMHMYVAAYTCVPAIKTNWFLSHNHDTAVKDNYTQSSLPLRVCDYKVLGP